MQVSERLENHSYKQIRTDDRTLNAVFADFTAKHPEITETLGDTIILKNLNYDKSNPPTRLETCTDIAKICFDAHKIENPNSKFFGTDDGNYTGVMKRIIGGEVVDYEKKLGNISKGQTAEVFAIEQEKEEDNKSYNKDFNKNLILAPILIGGGAGTAYMYKRKKKTSKKN